MGDPKHDSVSRGDGSAQDEQQQVAAPSVPAPPAPPAPPAAPAAPEAQAPAREEAPASRASRPRDAAPQRTQEQAAQPDRGAAFREDVNRRIDAMNAVRQEDGRSEMAKVSEPAATPAAGGFSIPAGDPAAAPQQAPGSMAALAQGGGSEQSAYEAQLAMSNERTAAAEAAAAPAAPVEAAAAPQQAPAPAAPAATEPAQVGQRPVPTPVARDMTAVHPNDEASSLAPRPDATFGRLPQASFASAIANRRDAAKARVKNADPGSATDDTLQADPDIALDEVSLNANLLVEAWRAPTSPLRTILAQDPTVDQELMVTDLAYALGAMVDFFDTHHIYGLTEKSPTTDEASVHKRIVRAHIGPSTLIHPIVFVMWNADHDGDGMKVSFDETAIAMAKTASDFLIGTEGTGKIDPGFFNMAPWYDTSDPNAEGLESQLRKMFNTDTADPLGLTDAEITRLADAIRKSWQGDVDEGFRSMLRVAREAGERRKAETSLTDDPTDEIRASRVASRILTDIYRKNRDIRILTKRFEGSWNSAKIPVAGPDAYSQDSTEPLFPHLLAEPGKPNSLYGVATAEGLPVASVKDKNGPFRWGAGKAKLGRRRWDLFRRRHSSVGGETTDEFLAAQISGAKELDESVRAVTTEARQMVLETAGFPDTSSPEAFRAWLVKFRWAYNQVAYNVNSAGALVRLDKTFAPHPIIERFQMPAIPVGVGDDVEMRKHLRKQFKNVYGGASMGRLFGKAALVKALGSQAAADLWLNKTLEEFIYENRVPQAAQGNKKTPFDTPEQFIIRLSDMRTSFARDYDRKLTKALGQFMSKSHPGKTIFRALIDMRIANRRSGHGPVNLDQELEMVLEALYLLGPEIFDFLGLTSPDMFARTALGQRFLEAKSAEQLGGVLYEAIARYRMAPVQRAYELWSQAEAGSEDAGKFANAWEAELDELASSSETWGALVRAYRAGDDIFTRIFAAKLTKKRKDQLIFEVVRRDKLVSNSRQGFEVVSGLFANPKGLYAKDRFISDFGHTTLLENITNASDKLDAYAKKNHWTYVEDVKKARKAFGRKGRLNGFLAMVAQDPSLLVHIGVEEMADVVISGMEKSYRSSEKAQQEGENSYIYSAVGNLINGGVYSDLAIGGDFAVGHMALDRFIKSPQMLARLLTDDTFSLLVYDGTKDILLTREVILGKNPSEADIWAFFENNPRVAMALRKTAMNNGVDVKTGGTFMQATASLKNTMIEVDKAYVQDDSDRRVLYLLADHPGFYAMAGLTQALTGHRRYQMRDKTADGIKELAALLSRVDPDEAEAFVDKLIEAAIPAERLAEIERVYLGGLAQEGTDPGPEDVRDTDEYGTGQIIARFKKDFVTYVHLIADSDIEGHEEWAELVEPADAAAMFHFGDHDTLEAYFDIIQVASSAKTALSTTINGGESKRNAGLIFLALVADKPCGAPRPTGVALGAFAANWQKYTSWQVLLINEYGEESHVPVSEVTLDMILAQSGEMVLLEDPSLCASPVVPCPRHATADQSTNLSGPQSPSLGRMLTSVRTLAGEALNLKVKTKGDDGKDSIVKVRIFDVIDTSISDTVNALFAAAGDQAVGLAAARSFLAEHIQATFTDMGYGTEMLLADYVNVAQVLIRPITAEDGVTIEQLKVLSIGQLNSIVKATVERELTNNGGKLTQEAATAAVLRALTDRATLTGALDVASVLAGFKAPTVMRTNSRINNNRESSIERNLELIEQIVEDTGVKPYNNKTLDVFEDKLRNAYSSVFDEWEKVAGTLPMEPYIPNVPRMPKPPGTPRFSYRVVGVIDVDNIVEGQPLPYVEAVGPANAWAIEAESPHAADAIVRAYELGLNVLLAGELPESTWQTILERTGEIDVNQGVEVGDARAATAGPEATFRRHTLIPMFDIRLNGGDSTIRGGAYDAGVFHETPDTLYAIYENPINEDEAADAELIATASFFDTLRVRKSGGYEVSVRAAFANMIHGLRQKGDLRNPVVTVANLRNLTDDFKDTYVGETADDAPVEFQNKRYLIDPGKLVVEDGSPDDVQLREALRLFVARMDEVGESGLLPDARPGEIVGFMRAELDDQVRYHPIRVFEEGHSAGAPTDFYVDGVGFDDETQRLTVRWRHEGPLAGRAFKLFEMGYAANKFMGRAKAIADMTLKSGMRISGYIATQSTASRRLLMRRQQKMTSLMYLARVAPYGYNLADKSETFPKNAALKVALRDGDTTIGMWKELLDAGDIQFFPAAMGDLNALCNDMARKAVRYGIDPTVVFASHHNGVPSNAWFNFQVLFEKGPNFQRGLMKLMNSMMPTLCPPGFDDTGDTLFNRDLQVLVPVRKDGVTVGDQWVDVFVGFHFLDEHVSGLSAAGARVAPWSLASANTLALGGASFSDQALRQYLAWSTIDAAPPAREALSSAMLPETAEDPLH